jgi:hypothetical protein
LVLRVSYFGLCRRGIGLFGCSAAIIVARWFLIICPLTKD